MGRPVNKISNPQHGVGGTSSIHGTFRGMHFGKPIPMNKTKTFYGKNGAVKVTKKATKDKHGNPIQSTTE